MPRPVHSSPGPGENSLQNHETVATSGRARRTPSPRPKVERVVLKALSIVIRIESQTEPANALGATSSIFPSTKGVTCSGGSGNLWQYSC